MTPLRNQIAERCVYDFLSQLPEVAEIVDLRGTREGDETGVTYLVKTTAGRTIRYLVRGDNHTTGELLYETVANRKTDEKGVMATTEADFILYYFTACHVLYRFKTKSLQNYFRDRQDRYDEQDRYLKKRGRKMQHLRHITVPGNASRAAIQKVGYLIPLSALHDKQWTRALRLPEGERLYTAAETFVLMNAYNQEKRKPRIREPRRKTGGTTRKKYKVFTYAR